MFLQRKYRKDVKRIWRFLIFFLVFVGSHFSTGVRQELGRGRPTLMDYLNPLRRFSWVIPIHVSQDQSSHEEVLHDEIVFLIWVRRGEHVKTWSLSGKSLERESLASMVFKNGQFNTNVSYRVKVSPPPLFHTLETLQLGLSCLQRLLLSKSSSMPERVWLLLKLVFCWEMPTVSPKLVSSLVTRSWEF